MCACHVEGGVSMWLVIDYVGRAKDLIIVKLSASGYLALL